MRIAAMRLNIKREYHRYRSLESYVRRKALMRSLVRGRWKRVIFGTSLAVYSTSRPAWRALGGNVSQ
jgi:hypothetical protein